ncbi:hypothetical protein L596_023442 [Steinernema carpocapsae]|uniref:Uncharacterized protein n=1 Tax=Steinernema carpocapsae TaxID=34508 RepID=A0A4U5MEF3_STECR|nr:hypothetical protein L596_023442 [Steinernema carpocapsae]
MGSGIWGFHHYITLYSSRIIPDCPLYWLLLLFRVPDYCSFEKYTYYRAIVIAYSMLVSSITDFTSIHPDDAEECKSPDDRFLQVWTTATKGFRCSIFAISNASEDARCGPYSDRLRPRKVASAEIERRVHQLVEGTPRHATAVAGGSQCNRNCESENCLKPVEFVPARFDTSLTGSTGSSSDHSAKTASSDNLIRRDQNPEPFRRKRRSRRTRREHSVEEPEKSAAKPSEASECSDASISGVEHPKYAEGAKPFPKRKIGKVFWMKRGPVLSDLTEVDLPIDDEVLESVVSGNLKIEKLPMVKRKMDPFGDIAIMKRDNHCYAEKAIFANTIQTTLNFRPNPAVVLPARTPTYKERRHIKWKENVTIYDGPKKSVRPLKNVVKVVEITAGMI